MDGERGPDKAFTAPASSKTVVGNSVGENVRESDEGAELGSPSGESGKLVGCVGFCSIGPVFVELALFVGYEVSKPDDGGFIGEKVVVDNGGEVVIGPYEVGKLESEVGPGELEPRMLGG